MKFAQPHLLWISLVMAALLFVFFRWSWRQRQALTAQFVRARLLPQLTTGLLRGRQKLRLWLVGVAVVLATFALAQPQWGFSWEEARQRGLDLVVAIDTSRSMLAEDVRPNRLERAKLAALDLIQLAGGDRLALIPFAGSAFLQCPLTLDEQAFRQNVDVLSVNIIPEGGSDLAGAIETAQEAFEKSGDDFKILVLMTDGEDHDSGALAAARQATEAGMRIFTLGVGTPAGELLRQPDDQGQSQFIKDSEGNVVKSRLNEGLLQQIATETGGFYLPLRASDAVETLYEKGLAPLPKRESEGRLYRKYHERFYWPLGLAFLALLVEFLLPEVRRSSAGSENNRPARTTPPLAILLLCMGLSLPIQASTTRAQKQYAADEYASALSSYEELVTKDPDDPRLYYNLGAAAYRLGDYTRSAEAFAEAVSAPDLALQQSAYYNLADAQYRLGEAEAEVPQKIEQWEQAVKNLEAAVELAPDDQDASFNLELIKRKLEELKQQQEQQPDQGEGDNQEQESEDSSSDDQQSDQGDQDQQQDQQQQQSDQEQNQDSSDQQEPSSSESPDQEEQQDQQQQQSGEDQSQEAQGDESSQPPPGTAEEPGDPNAAKNPPPSAVQMSVGEAEQMLDAQKNNERAMIFLPPQNKPGRPQYLKDW